eukprot:TRINITY_DN221_c0_g1_i1.p1 TRINITY_DN221_c0_g1~~TRINITY_DN221_c0_g1_i1.p1  ORF type:complete len:284 (+),score=40.11 TRINITY_DN221_c0_g1_i1:51-854(+)
MFGFHDQPDKARLVVQADLLDDSTACLKCGMADTLAYRCHSCEKVFCNECIGFGRHGCGGSRREVVDSGVPDYVVCEMPGCGGKNYVKMGCGSCGKNYCSTHRVEADHGCTEAVKVVKKIVPAKPKTASGSVLTPPDLHVDDRFSLTVYIPPPFLPSDRPNPIKAIIHKKWGTGRAIDFLTQHLAAPQNTSLTLLNLTTLEPLPRIASFQELVKKGKLSQAPTLALVDSKWLADGVKSIAALPELAAYKSDRAWGHVRRQVEVEVKC